MEHLFDGLGTELLSLLISFLFGGGVGYFVGIKTKVSQKQKAGKNSKQTQIGHITINKDGKSDCRK